MSAMAGGDLLQAGERPLLERLGKNRVVSVGDHGAYDGHGLVKLDAMLGGEQANELRDDHGGVRVVNLDHGVIGQICRLLPRSTASSIRSWAALLTMKYS